MVSEVEVQAALVAISSKYELFQCQACADEMRAWLEAHQVPGIYIQIHARIGDFIISERVGDQVSITRNGIHYGVEVFGKIFDNLPDTGILRQLWLDDFESIGGYDIVETTF
jgi:hypothetical protein